MKTAIKLEEFVMFGLSIWLFKSLGMEWWWYVLFILVPDIGMLGYLVNTKVGAFTYNLFHHKGIALLILMIGWTVQSQYLQFAGIILFGHASLDRIFGYGLKYPSSFQDTHLGKIGKAR
ncbi:DUF4260 domain-containing protein [Flavobacteriaceae bacterium F08102]|nr:DUF4260 domain-containing protein [Flavobacteriaceae bacterium F08102]